MLQKAQAEKKYNYQLRFNDSGPMAIEDLLNGRIAAIGLDAAPAEDAMRKGKPVQEVGVFGSDEFGVAIRKVSDAEKIFNDQKEEFIRSITARAQAAAAMDMAAEEYKKAIEKMQEADAAEKAGVTFGDRFKSFMARSAASEDPSGALAGADLSPEAYAKERIAELNQSATDLFQSGNDLIRKYIEYSNEEQETLKRIGLQTTDALVSGSGGAIKASIQQKQEALEQLTNKADYNKALKEIEEEQKKLEALNGKQGGGIEKESAPEGALASIEGRMAAARTKKRMSNK